MRTLLQRVSRAEVRVGERVTGRIERGYLLLVGFGHDDGEAHAASVTTTRATLAGAKPGWKVAVKAVDGRGLEGWDWARAEVK